MEKKKYEKPTIEIIKLNDTNIITCSVPWEEFDDDIFG